MFGIIKRQKLYDCIICASLLLLIVFLVIYPQVSVNAAKDGITLCLNVIVPSLFPFFVLSSLFVRTGLTRYAGKLLQPIMRPVFNVNGECSSALVLGIIGGYPIGAKTVISLYENKRCTKHEAERMLAFCNNSGPAFILGVVGAGIFSSGKIGLLIYLAHALASLSIGIIFRNWGNGEGKNNVQKAVSSAASEPFYSAFVESIKSSFSSVFNICGFVIFFTVLIKIFTVVGFMSALANVIGFLLSPLGFDDIWAEKLITGIFELSSGVWTLKGFSGNTVSSITMASFMLGWAGLSVHCQVLSFVGGSGLSVVPYMLGKFLHGIMAAVFSFLLSFLFLGDISAGAFWQIEIRDLSESSFFSVLSSSVAAAICAIGFFTTIFIVSRLKKAKIPKKGRK